MQIRLFRFFSPGFLYLTTEKPFRLKVRRFTHLKGRQLGQMLHLLLWGITMNTIPNPAVWGCRWSHGGTSGVPWIVNDQNNGSLINGPAVAVSLRLPLRVQRGGENQFAARRRAAHRCSYCMRRREISRTVTHSSDCKNAAHLQGALVFLIVTHLKRHFLIRIWTVNTQSSLQYNVTQVFQAFLPPVDVSTAAEDTHNEWQRNCHLPKHQA